MKPTRQPPVGVQEPVAWREGYDAGRRGAPLAACRYPSALLSPCRSNYPLSEVEGVVWHHPLNNRKRREPSGSAWGFLPKGCPANKLEAVNVVRTKALEAALTSAVPVLSAFWSLARLQPVPASYPGRHCPQWSDQLVCSLEGPCCTNLLSINVCSCAR